MSGKYMSVKNQTEALIDIIAKFGCMVYSRSYQELETMIRVVGNRARTTQTPYFDNLFNERGKLQPIHWPSVKYI